jgi:hypothetical protein
MREVAAGNLVLVFQNLVISFYPVWHYAVVIGFNRVRNVQLLIRRPTPLRWRRWSVSTR